MKKQQPSVPALQALYGKEFVGGDTKPAVEAKVLARCARVAYERFLKEAGYEHDARCPKWEGLKTFHQRRWASIARAVIIASRGEVERVRAGNIHVNDERAGGLRSRDAKATGKVPANRSGRARRR